MRRSTTFMMTADWTIERAASCDAEALARMARARKGGHEDGWLAWAHRALWESYDPKQERCLWAAHVGVFGPPVRRLIRLPRVIIKNYHAARLEQPKRQDRILKHVGTHMRPVDINNVIGIEWQLSEFFL